jgi:uncharacterized protein (DUF1800 family)
MRAMTLRLRCELRYALALCATLLSAAAANAANDATPLQDRPQLALHVLDRLGYGPRPGDVARVQALGMDHYIEQQLQGDKAPDSDAVRAQLAPLNTLRMNPETLWREYGPETVRAAGDDPVARKAAEEHSRIPLHQAEAARLIRALDSPQQLNEVMVDFWFNHFNVFQGKGIDHLLVGDYERNAIRPYALGHFRDLLGATAKHPAMLFYLDNAQSAAPHAPPRGRFFGLFGGKKKAPGGLNENYAREVMELHTLGVDGGYTQKDVTELARILTGWTFRRQSNRRMEGGVFIFDPNRHDDGDKLFLGQHFHGGGQAEGERALDMLANSPVTAHHLSFQIAQYFIADDPPPALVDQLAQVYLKARGDIREVLRALFFSAEFRAPENIGNKFKTPYQYVVSALRAADVHVSNFKPVTGALAQLGMPLFGCPTPDGYKNTEAAWRNPDAMIHRINLAVALGNGAARYRQPDETGKSERADFAPPDPAQLQATLADLFSANTLAAYDAAPPKLRAAVLLGSPEFMRR